MHVAGFLRMWIGLALFFICSLLNCLVLGGVVCTGVCTSCLIVFYRQRIREKLGLKSFTRTNCVFDLVYVCCCPWCAISQEAQVVRYAYQNSGVTASAPPRLLANSSQVPGW